MIHAGSKAPGPEQAFACQFAPSRIDTKPLTGNRQLILGESELKEGLVTVKEQKWELVDGKKVKIESTDKGVKVRRNKLVRWLKDSPTYADWRVGSGCRTRLAVLQLAKASGDIIKQLQPDSLIVGLELGPQADVAKNQITARQRTVDIT
ncbi:predicted protein [Postia placenta Mad-698-R]|uniref:Uncharacterized protein n=1 Tax=Postia placenta MAD-698-R-SB12 TaxID=670580 RepID=A0A1X6NDY0_9APHY|nr:hypothetical protein POSPLADRAFT_1128140 [Postia placenta MAD-698-R-SB12]EED79625.1 predicted protein [Postia placenta Mad-698-R]OSX66845.1 hypothetical protein POSPLADRAFT_1128140 [Postia placenta MAD-698-R-SB12]